jgi:Ca-activated chloride channel family protein
MFQLASIYWLLLLPAPFLIARLFPVYRDRRVTVRVPFLDRVARLTGQSTDLSGSTAAPRGQRFVHFLVWALLVLALARPQQLEEPLVKTLPLRDMLVAVDLSGSMDTRDFTREDGSSIDRLEAVKLVLGDFLERRDGDRIALVVFGSAAFVQVPFTEDKDVLRQMLDDTVARMAGPRTMLGDAIGLAITLFDRSDVDERLMIVLTDGNDTGSQIPPARAAEIARDKEIVIHTIGVGDPTAVGEEVLDEVALRAVSEITGGSYYYASDREQLELVYTELDKLTPRKVDTISYRPVTDLFHLPLGLALLLTFLYHGVLAVSSGLSRARIKHDTEAVAEA